MSACVGRSERRARIGRRNSIGIQAVYSADPAGSDMPLFRHRRLNVPPRAPRQARVLVAALGVATLFAVLASGGSGVSTASVATACIRSGSDAAIQAALTGPGPVASLCPHSVFRLSNTVAFTAPHQVIQTQGLPGAPA